jgi:hypothetical protein
MQNGVHFSGITVDFGAPFDTHQLAVNEDTRALAHFSNIENVPMLARS